MNSLKRNLKLDGSLNASMSGIDGAVDVIDFSIYNLFEYYDRTTGARLHYRFIRYSFDGGVWSVYPYSIDEPVTVFNSFDDTYTPLDSTTVVANLKFRLRITENNTWLGIPVMAQEVNYQRLVDIAE